MGGFYRQAVGARDCNFATRWRSECLGQTQEDRIWGGQAFEGGAIRADKNKSCAAAAPATSAIVDGFGTRLPHIGTSAIAASGKIRSFTAKTGDSKVITTVVAREGEFRTNCGRTLASSSTDGGQKGGATGHDYWTIDGNGASAASATSAEVRGAASEDWPPGTSRSTGKYLS